MTSAVQISTTSTVIIPAARDGFGPSGKPCWLREHPAGRLVIHHLLSSLDLTAVSRVIIATTVAHTARWLRGDPSALVENLKSTGVVPASTELIILALARETTSAADTVACAIRQCHVEGPIFVKDQDGSFQHRVVPGADYVVGLRLTENCEVENLPAKSFLLTTGALLSNIVEKRVVSDIICVGGYAFQQASGFLDALASVEQIHERVAQNLSIGQQQPLPTSSSSSSLPASSASESLPASSRRIFLSHLVQYQMLHQRRVFSVELSQQFADWKSDAAWRRFVQRFRNVEMSLEGVLFASSDSDDVVGNMGVSNWKPIVANIDYVKALPRDRTHITLRTSRPACEEERVRRLLTDAGVPFNVIVFNSFSSTSYLVTAYSADGDHIAHPSSVAYSIPESTKQQLGSVLQFPPH